MGNIKNPNQKLKILYLMKYLIENTDESHAITITEIQDALLSNGISAERKSLYDDMESLRVYGLDIEKTGERRGCSYYVANREFELAELKLLVDAVQSSKFITVKKSSELIQKIEGFTSIHQRKYLQRQVYVANRIKTINESIYYNIDTIHHAINQGKKIEFLYYEWVIDFSNKNKVQKQYKKEGKKYEVSPWHLIWDDENYYLITFHPDLGIIKHFRVDKMEKIEILEANRDGEDYLKKFDMSTYTQKVFGMFSGESEKVKLRFKNSLIHVILERFGKDEFIVEDDENHFAITTNVVVSPQFFGWLAGFGNQAEILSPNHVIKDYEKHIDHIASIYK